MASLALFDFDGTLTDRDTMLAFCRSVVGPYRFVAGMIMLSPMLFAYALRLLSADRAKVLLRAFLAGRTRAELDAAGERFADLIDGWLRNGAMARLRWHRAQGHTVLLVSASLDLWLAPWARRHGLTLVCTGGAWDGDVFTGRLATPNCNGPEKVRRVEALHDVREFERIYAYGDSSGDREMLALAHEPSFRPFR